MEFILATRLSGCTARVNWWCEHDRPNVIFRMPGRDGANKKKPPRKSFRRGLQSLRIRMKLIRKPTYPITSSHVVDHDLTKTGTADLRGAFHETGKVVSNFLGFDGLFH